VVANGKQELEKVFRILRMISERYKRLLGR